MQQTNLFQFIPKCCPKMTEKTHVENPLFPLYSICRIVIFGNTLNKRLEYRKKFY
jgi:hypothetical protein